MVKVEGCRQISTDTDALGPAPAWYVTTYPASLAILSHIHIPTRPAKIQEIHLSVHRAQLTRHISSSKMTLPDNKNQRIVLGTMTFGPDPETGARVTSLEDYKKALDVFAKYGHNELDTARVYCGGKVSLELQETRNAGMLPTRHPHRESLPLTRLFSSKRIGPSRPATRSEASRLPASGTRTHRER